MKVAHFFITIESGGAERLILNLCRYFKSNYPKIESHVVVYQQKKKDLFHEFQSSSIPVSYLSIAEKPFTFKSLYTIYSWIKKNRPDIVHCHAGSRADKFILLSAFFAGVKKRYCTIHNMDQSKSFRARIGYWLVSILSNKIIAVSEGARDFYIKNHFFNPKKIRVIYNCPSFIVNNNQHWNNQISSKKVINLINIGGLRKQKGQIYLIEAIKLLNNTGHNFHLYIYGPDRFNYGHILYDKVNQLNLNNVSFCGEIENVFEKLITGDIFITSSIKEALPLAVIEAMSIGIPIIATDIAPHREILGPLEYKFLVEPYSATAIAEAILRLVQDNDEKHIQLSSEEIARSMDFSIDNTSRKYFELYNQ